MDINAGAHTHKRPTRQREEDAAIQEQLELLEAEEQYLSRQLNCQLPVY